jgi:hypothetical protein
MNPRPEGWPTVIPRLFTNDVVGLVNFLRVTFRAAWRHGARIAVAASSATGLRPRTRPFAVPTVPNNPEFQV